MIAPNAGNCGVSPAFAADPRVHVQPPIDGSAWKNAALCSKRTNLVSCDF